MKSPIENSKFKIVSLGITILFLLNLGFLTRWQIFEHDRFVALAKERIVDNKIPSIRGEILARDGTALAYSEPRFNIVVYKTELEFAEKHNRQTRGEFTHKVSSILGISEDELNKKLDVKSSWIKVADKVNNSQKTSLLDLKTDLNPEMALAGLRIEYTSQRVYPENDLACHVVGFVGQNDLGEDVGRAGLEYYWEGLLKEQEGYNNNEVDSFGNIIALNNIDNIEARRGATIYTTIDKNLQAIAQKSITDAVKKYKAKSGTIIIMDPKTGEILTLANAPGYDPNQYSKADPSAFKNSAISDPAELGSVGKVFTMAAALNEHKVEPNTIVIRGHTGCTIVKEHERDWKICTADKKPQGAMSATQALVKSDNLALYEVSKLVGREKLEKYLQAFGVGRRTDVDIAGESNGILKEGSKWSKVDAATFSYGQGYQMTSLQAITGIAAVANNGQLMRPYIVSKVSESDGKMKEFSPAIVGRPVTVETTDKLKNMMYEVFKSNLSEYRYKNLRQYKIAMKSGTGLVPYKDKAGYSKEINATYIGFDATDNESFIMLVKLEEPTAVERLSFYSARIVWLDTFIKIKDYVGMKKTMG